MADGLLDLVRALSFAIQDGRTLSQIHGHGVGEMEELDVEIERDEKGRPPGPDGVVGEAMDVILCMLDIIYRKDPDITNEELLDIARRKGRKWLEGVRTKLAAAEEAVGIT